MSLCQIKGQIACIHVATKTTEPPAQFLLFGCKDQKLTFGAYYQFVAGKNQPEQCNEFVARLNKTLGHVK